MILFLLLLFATSILSYIALRRLSRMVYAQSVFDQENERTVHKGAIPRLGGVIFFPVITLTVSLFLAINSVLSISIHFPLEEFYDLLFLLPAMILLYAIGVIDDLVGLSYRQKFKAQILSSSILFLSGVSLSGLDGLLFIEELPKILQYPIVVFFFLMVINSINLIDGIDGLATSLVLLGMLFYIPFFIYVNMYLYVIICVSVIGCLGAFLRMNLYGTTEKRTKIFMGDTGSLTLGLLLSFMALRLLTPIANTALPLQYVVAPLLIPCFDLFHVFVLRILSKKNPFKPDKSHIHHRLMALGLTQRQTLVVILLYSIAFSLFNILGYPFFNINVLLLLDIVIWITSNMLIANLSRKRGCV
ncbi:MraY family glycosyltransferase [Porphyromonas gingivalis]|nr:MraY family glycosyltransferase [Porphyromonas gingivalis]